jgi:uncharacterized protein involved in exopolysaccharide biosynthesis
LPRLAVPYADLYRQVRIQEAVYELLTQQYERARIQEAKDIPVVSVIDHPGVPEKKSFPPRLLLAVMLAALATGLRAALLIVQQRWDAIPQNDPTKLLFLEVTAGLRRQAYGWKTRLAQSRSER